MHACAPLAFRRRASHFFTSSLLLLFTQGACSKDAATATVSAAPLSRLTPEQYGNAVDDLLSVRAFPNKGLLSEPADRQGVATHPSVSVLDVRNYLLDAAAIAESAKKSGVLMQLAPCDSPNDATAQAACADRFIDTMGHKLFRRALNDEERTTLRAVYGQGVQPVATGGLGLDYLDAMQFLLEAMLNEPQFLYVFEAGQAGEKAPQPGDIVPLTPTEMATRLAMFLWQSTPDDELSAAAIDGRLATPEGIAEQVRRMLGAPGRPEPRALRVMHNFAVRWLSLGDTAAVRKSVAIFPNFDDATRASMFAETSQFVSHVTFEDDGKLSTLLTAPYSFVNVPLSTIYGLPNQRFDGLTLVKTLLNPQERAGLLTQPSFLATRAHSADASPTLRGLFVRQRLMCEQMAPPPPSANTTPPPTDFTIPTRERYKEHSRNPSCAACHVRMDPVGAGFEKYDAAGGYQTYIGSYKIDGVGQVYGSADLDGPFDGPVALAQKLAQSPTVEDCFVRQIFRFATGRYETMNTDGSGDGRSIETVRARFAASGQDIRTLLAELAISDAFRYRKITDGEGQP